MSQKSINAMIPLALEKVKVFVNNGTVESKHMSGIAAFGVSVLQSGKYATKLFYQAKSDARQKLPKIIVEMLKESKGIDKTFENHTKEDILDATTALKLAIRTYKKVDNKEAQDE